MVHGFAHRHRRGGVLAQLRMARQILGRQRLFDPGQPQSFESVGTAHRFGPIEPLIGVGHQLKTWPHRRAHRTQARHIFADMRAANLDLGPLEAFGLCLKGLIDKFLGRQVQPAAFCGVERHPGLCTTEQPP